MKKRTTIVIRKKICIAIILASVLCVLGGGNLLTYDQEAFCSAYNESVNFLGFENGYFVFQNTLHQLGVPYQWYKLLVSVISIVSLFLISEHYKANTAWILFLYFCFPFAHDAYNLRNTLAAVIISISFCFLANERKKYTLLSFLLCALAIFFHRASVFYFIPWLVYFIWKNLHLFKPFVKVLLSIVVLFSITSAIFPRILSIVASFLGGFLDKLLLERKAGYLEINGRFGFLFYFVIQLICIFLLYLCYRQYYAYKKKLNFEKNSKYMLIEKKSSLVQVMLVVSITMLFMIPMYKMNNNFFRVFRNIMPLICVSISSCLNDTKGINNNRKLIIKILTIGLFVFLLLWDITGSVSDKIWGTMIHGNWILGT